jgi:voltage-dependent calcium channel T type alpha-1H
MRLISRNEQLKVAVRALFYAIPNILNITIIMLLFFLIFGVIAVSYFKGKFYYCTGSIYDLLPINHSKWDCLNFGGIWLNRFYTFDDSISALLTLFVAATTAGWADLMMNCATATDLDYSAVPFSEASPVWMFFFIFFVIVGSFFFLNLFVGVVISTFHSEHDKIGGNNLLTEKQKEWIDLRLLVLRSEPHRKLKKPKGRCRSFFFSIVDSLIYQRIIFFCIIGNTVVLFLKWYEQG